MGDLLAFRPGGAAVNKNCQRVKNSAARLDFVNYFRIY